MVGLDHTEKSGEILCVFWELKIRDGVIPLMYIHGFIGVAAENITSAKGNIHGYSREKKLIVAGIVKKKLNLLEKGLDKPQVCDYNKTRG